MTAPTTAAAGYINTLLPTGYSLVVNPLNNTGPMGNTVTNLFGSYNTALSDGDVIQKWTGSGYQNFNYFGDGYWEDENFNPVAATTLAVGDGAVVYNSDSAGVNTFIGEVDGIISIDPIVLEPVLTPAPGIYLRGRIFPAAPGTFENIMGRAPIDFDAVLKLDTAGNPLISYFMGGEWFDPLGGNTAPTLFVGEAAFFDTTGGAFSGFVLPSGITVPEPTAVTLGIVCLFATALRQRRTNRS